MNVKSRLIGREIEILYNSNNSNSSPSIIDSTSQRKHWVWKALGKMGFLQLVLKAFLLSGSKRLKVLDDGTVTTR